MTEASIQAAIHSLYEGDTSTPGSTDEEYLTRREYINAAINRWEHYEKILWNELWGTLANAADGTKTTTDGTAAYDCPTNFVFIGGYLRIVDSDGNSTYYRQIKAQKDQLFDNVSSEPNYFYVTGNPQDGHQVTIHPTPSATGNTISYEYYKTADTVSDTTDVPEMLDPYFTVFYVLSKLFRNDGKHGEATEARMEAENKLRNMKTKNVMKGWYQDTSVEDIDFVHGVEGFGK